MMEIEKNEKMKKIMMDMNNNSWVYIYHIAQIKVDVRLK